MSKSVKKPDRRESSNETRARICRAALQLFNQHGTMAVSTNKIAEAAGLSIGNFYYHFKNREEVILEIFGSLIEATSRGFAIDLERPLNLEDFERILSANQAILWEYRFFYREMMPLLSRDPELATAYRSLRETGMANTENLIRLFSASGVLKPIDSDSEVRQIAEAAWIFSEFYAAFVEAGGEEITPSHFEAAILLFRQHIKFYLPETTEPDLEVLRARE